MSSQPVSLPATPLPVVLKVDFSLITPDGNRKIAFTLEKDSNGTSVTWFIAFQLYKKGTDGTWAEPVISLSVQVSPALHTQAQNVFTNGLTPTQAAHATGPAADAAQAVADGTGSRLAANNSIQNTLK